MRNARFYTTAIVLSLFLVSGCALLDRARKDYNASVSDPGISAQLADIKQHVSSFVAGAASSNPVTSPVANYIGYGVGSIASLIAGIYLGRKKRNGKISS